MAWTERQKWYRMVYLQGTHWKMRSRTKIASVGGCCETCGARRRAPLFPGDTNAVRLECHHLNYDRVPAWDSGSTDGWELDSDLKVLCSDCHKKQHTKEAEEKKKIRQQKRNETRRKGKKKT